MWNSAALGSPGNAYRFFYSERQEKHGEIPSILVSGDDDGFMYMADPVSTDPTEFNWSYTVNTIYKTKDFSPLVTPVNAPTVGQPTVWDVNGDGCNDIIVAAYSLQQLVFLEQRDTLGCR